VSIEDIANRTGTGIALAYRSGEASPVQVVDCLLDRIEKTRGDNIFITVTAERARKEAKAAEARYKRGEPASPLDGVPIGWKDLFDVAGSPTTAGSKLFLDQPAKTKDIACVANAAAAGMVSMGKLNLTELAYSGVGLNPHYGTPVNPNDRKVPRSPGGSSSGSGAAVAARLVPCAVGSDTGGSVRIPASFNGVVGFKTSTGRIDATGLIPLAKTYDTIGPLAHTVEDCLLLDMVMRGAVTSPVRRAFPGQLTLIAPTNMVLEDAEQAVADNFERSLEALAKAGVTVRRESVTVLDEVLEMNAKHGTITAAEAYHEYREIFDSEKAAMIDRRVVRRAMDGKKMSANDLLSIQRGRQRLIGKLKDLMGDALLIMPTTPITAPEVSLLESDDETFSTWNLRALRNTTVGNILDLCGIAMPNGRNANGMPTSILFSAGHGEDDRLLGAALAFEGIVGKGEDK
jgi:aspartyl-tRNA(Asn)/glutamyl-tRNA(Gln) amidotransferase subunit A